LAQIDDISRHRQAGHYTSGTNIGAGLQRGRIELEQNARPASLKMVILMTDGQANEPEGRANEFLLEEAQLCANNGYPVFTISLGTDADPVVMQRIADMTGGVHFNIPAGGGVAEYQEQLQQVFRKIAEKRPLRLVR
jgi:Mg-chelatase subunit ChlD